ncbi:hypothetical protein C4K01_5810 [Pseudomonas synxantha]|nr:hypothetical protein C4K01_5810 [Pseudomonas synxantha]
MLVQVGLNPRKPFLNSLLQRLKAFSNLENNVDPRLYPSPMNTFLIFLYRLDKSIFILFK